MTARELIGLLEELVEIHGDLLVHREDDTYGDMAIEKVEPILEGHVFYRKIYSRAAPQERILIT